MGMAINKRLMKEAEIPAFVTALIETGWDICAVGSDRYVVSEANSAHATPPGLAKIDERFGERDFIREQIAAYLRSIGRYVEVSASSTQ